MSRIVPVAVPAMVSEMSVGGDGLLGSGSGAGGSEDMGAASGEGQRECATGVRDRRR